jgi:hypothetical protein
LSTGITDSNAHSPLKTWVLYRLSYAFYGSAFNS